MSSAMPIKRVGCCFTWNNHSRTLPPVFFSPCTIRKHVLYSVNMLRSFQRRNCCMEIAENNQNIVRPHREVIVSVVIGSVGQPSWIGAPLETFKSKFPRRIAFQWFISFIIGSSTCKISRRTETPECAAFPVLWLNVGASITQDGQVQRRCENGGHILNMLFKQPIQSYPAMQKN